MAYTNERTKIMKSQLEREVEEVKQKIKELLDKYGFSIDKVSIYINHTQTNKIQVQSRRDDIPEEITMTIRHDEHNWHITNMSGDDKTRHFKDDKEKMLKFIEKKLQELVKRYKKLGTATY